MIIIFYTRNVNYLKPYKCFSRDFLSWIYYILCVCTVYIYHGLLWIIINIFYTAALVNTTHGFHWRWDVLHAKWHGYP